MGLEFEILHGFLNLLLHLLLSGKAVFVEIFEPEIGVDQRQWRLLNDRSGGLAKLFELTFGLELVPDLVLVEFLRRPALLQRS